MDNFEVKNFSRYLHLEEEEVLLSLGMQKTQAEMTIRGCKGMRLGAREAI